MCASVLRKTTHLPQSGDTSPSIRGHISLYPGTHPPQFGDTSPSIRGQIRGHLPQSRDIPLNPGTHLPQSGDISPSIRGHLPQSGDASPSIRGHLPQSGDTSLNPGTHLPVPGCCEINEKKTKTGRSEGKQETGDDFVREMVLPVLRFFGFSGFGQLRDLSSFFILHNARTSKFKASTSFSFSDNYVFPSLT